MDALDVVMVCVRRWWVMIPVLLLTAAAGAGLVREQQPVYHASGSYALVFTHGKAISPTKPDPRNANPLGANNGALVGEALIADFMSPSTQLELGGVGNSGSAPDQPESRTRFSILLPQQGTSVYLVQTWGPSEEGARAVVDAVLAAAPSKATSIQDRANAPEMSQYTTFVTSPTQVELLPPPSTMKLLVAVAAVGLMAGAALSLVVDRVLQRRRRRLALGSARPRFRPRGRWGGRHSQQRTGSAPISESSSATTPGDEWAIVDVGVVLPSEETDDSAAPLVDSPSLSHDDRHSAESVEAPVEATATHATPKAEGHTGRPAGAEENDATPKAESSHQLNGKHTASKAETTAARNGDHATPNEQLAAGADAAHAAPTEEASVEATATHATPKAEAHTELPAGEEANHATPKAQAPAELNGDTAGAKVEASSPSPPTPRTAARRTRTRSRKPQSGDRTDGPTATVAEGSSKSAGGRTRSTSNPPSPATDSAPTTAELDAEDDELRADPVRSAR